MWKSLTHLQLQAIAILQKHEAIMPGKRLREAMGECQSLGAFYQFMARLERDGLVKGHCITGESGYRERGYFSTEAGRICVGEAKAFYRDI